MTVATATTRSTRRTASTRRVPMRRRIMRALEEAGLTVIDDLQGTCTTPETHSDPTLWVFVQHERHHDPYRAHRATNLIVLAGVHMNTEPFQRIPAILSSAARVHTHADDHGKPGKRWVIIDE